MGLFINGNNISESSGNVEFLGKSISKVFFGSNLVWQKNEYIRHIGNLVTMLSSNTPSPFSCSTLCARNRNHPEYAFNGVVTNRVYTMNKFEDVGHFGTICELSFGSTLLIHRMEVIPYIYDIGGSGVSQGARSIACYGVKEDGTELEICRIDGPKGCQINTNEASTNKTMYTKENSNYSTTPFIAIRWKVADDTYQGRYGMYSCKITEWSSKDR